MPRIFDLGQHEFRFELVLLDKRDEPENYSCSKLTLANYKNDGFMDSSDVFQKGVSQ